MDNKELLIKIGFSTQYIEHLEKADFSNLSNLNDYNFSNENYDFSVHDTSEFILESQIKKDFCNLEIR